MWTLARVRLDPGPSGCKEVQAQLDKLPGEALPLKSRMKDKLKKTSEVRSNMAPLDRYGSVS